jgi:hypothetical protein
MQEAAHRRMEDREDPEDPEDRGRGGRVGRGGRGDLRRVMGWDRCQGKGDRRRDKGRLR